MDFELSEEQRLVRDMVRDFAEREIAPRAPEVDKSEEYPTDNIRKMAELIRLADKGAEVHVVHDGKPSMVLDIPRSKPVGQEART